MTKHRIFLGLHLPETIKAELQALQTAIPTARWVAPPQLHLTLVFIGDISDVQVADLEKALVDVRVPTFEMRVQGVGCFPENLKKPTRVLWAGVSAPIALNHLQSDVKGAVQALFEVDEKPFRPHITLARLRSEKVLAEVENFVMHHKQYRGQGFTITQFALIESHLSPQGATYITRRVYGM